MKQTDSPEGASTVLQQNTAPAGWTGIASEQIQGLCQQSRHAAGSICGSMSFHIQHLCSKLRINVDTVLSSVHRSTYNGHRQASLQYLRMIGSLMYHQNIVIDGKLHRLCKSHSTGCQS